MKKFLLLCFLFSFLTSISLAQVSDYILSVNIGDAKEKTPLTLTADLVTVENISSLYIAYKPFGENEFQKIEMLITGNTAAGTIPSDVVVPPYLDYYIIINLKDGNTQTYPVGIDQGANTLQIAVAGVSDKDKEIIVLSPVDGEILTKDNLLISISFIKASDAIDISKTKIYLNGTDLSSQALIAGDLIVISGENIQDQIKYGAGSLQVDVYDKEENLYHTIGRTMQIVTTEIFAEVESRWKFIGKLKGESRSENFGSLSTWRNNISADMNASDDTWRLNGYLYFTSEEKGNLQPYNRYSAVIKGSDWLELQVGDTYPRYPNIILDGKRIRGVSGYINLGAFNIQATYGETERKIEGKIDTLYQEQPSFTSNIIAVDQNKYGAPYAKVRLGTYSRNLFAIRPSFGSGENFQLGFTYLHSIDDKESVELSARPQENAVFGTDIKFALDDQNILFTTQAAVSLFNKDIYSGDLTDSEIDSIFGEDGYYNVDPDQVKTMRDVLGTIITVNQYIGPLNPQELASLAAETALNLNYLNNSFRASYIYRGNDYYSFGQSFLRTDVKGYNIVDRIRMFDNKVFLSLGYENLEDNLQDTKIATTKYQTLSASISIFPRVDFPNITLGYNRYDYNNGLKLADTTYQNYVVDDLTNRFLIQLSYDFVAGIRHSSSLSFITQTRDDESFAPIDANYISSTFTLNSYWYPELSTIFQIIYGSNELKKFDRTTSVTTTEPFDYVTLSVGARYKMMENKLLLSANLSPSFGDFKRQALELLADYNILANLNLAFQARIFRIPGSSTNSIIGLTTRYTF